MPKPAESAAPSPYPSGPVELTSADALGALKLSDVNEAAVAAGGGGGEVPDAEPAAGFPPLSADMARRRDRNGRPFDPRVHRHVNGVPELRTDGRLQIAKRAGSKAAQVSSVNVAAAEEPPTAPAPGGDAAPGAGPTPDAPPVGLPPAVVGTMYAETAGRLVRVALGDEWKSTDVERKAYPEVIAAIAAKRGWGRAVEPEWALLALVGASIAGRVHDPVKAPETARKVSWLKARALRTWCWMRGVPYVEEMKEMKEVGKPEKPRAESTVKTDAPAEAPASSSAADVDQVARPAQAIALY